MLSAWSAADLWPDAGTGLRALHASGLRLAVLTNGSGEGRQAGPVLLLQSSSCPCHAISLAPLCMRSACDLLTHAADSIAADSIARSVLQKAGLEGVFSCLLDVGMAGAWKPAPQSYAWAVEQLGLAPGQVKARWAASCKCAGQQASVLGSEQAARMVERLQLSAQPAPLQPAPLPVQVMMVASHPWDIYGALQVTHMCPACLHAATAAALAPACYACRAGIELVGPAQQGVGSLVCAARPQMQAGLQAAYVQRDRWDAYPAFLPQQPQLVASSFNQLAEQLAAA